MFANTGHYRAYKVDHQTAVIYNDFLFAYGICNLWKWWWCKRFYKEKEDTKYWYTLQFGSITVMIKSTLATLKTIDLTSSNLQVVRSKTKSIQSLTTRPSKEYRKCYNNSPKIWSMCTEIFYIMCSRLSSQTRELKILPTAQKCPKSSYTLQNLNSLMRTWMKKHSYTLTIVFMLFQMAVLAFKVLLSFLTCEHTLWS